MSRKHSPDVETAETAGAYNTELDSAHAMSARMHRDELDIHRQFNFAGRNYPCIGRVDHTLL